MIKSIKRNVGYIPKNRKSMYDQEYNLTHELLASDDTNIEVEYYNASEAKAAYQAIKKYTVKVRQPLGVSQRGQSIIIYKQNKKEN